MSGIRNRQWRLARHPVGMIAPGDFTLVAEPVPDLAEGQVVVRVHYVSLDPTNRIWASGVPSYLPPVQIGEVMRSLGIGVVERSRDPAMPEGTRVEGLFGWQEYAVARGAELSRVVDYPGVPGIGYVTSAGYPELARHARVLATYEGFDAHANAVSEIRDALLAKGTVP